MPSLNLDLNYFDHSKAMRIESRLGHGADVLPLRLWAYVGRHNPEHGRLAMLEEEIERVCRWWGEKGEMVSVMIEIGFLERDGNFYKVHDWHDHSGHLSTFKKRAVKAARKRWGIKRKRSNASSNASDESKQCPSSAVHSSTLPAQQALTPPAVPAGAFDLIWTKYPRKIGKDESRDKFKAQVKTFQDWLDIQNAISRFIAKLQTDKTEEKFIPHGSTWFNRRWRDWVNYTEGSHGANGSAGISHYADIAKRARQAMGLREPPAGGPLHAGLRDLPDVSPKAEDVDGTGKRGDVAALEILRGAGLEIKSGR